MKKQQESGKKNNIITWIILAIVAILFIKTAFSLNNNDSPTIASTNGTSTKPVPTVAIQPVEKLDTSKYEIIKTNHAPTVKNFYVLIKFPNFNEQNLQEFVDKFRAELCLGSCNISLYDTKSILSIVDKYPLQGKEYIRVADHFIAMSTFDTTEIWWYPFQDFMYKEYGGRNRKKTPIQ